MPPKFFRQTFHTTSGVQRPHYYELDTLEDDVILDDSSPSADQNSTSPATLSVGVVDDSDLPPGVIAEGVLTDIDDWVPAMDDDDDGSGGIRLFRGSKKKQSWLCLALAVVLFVGVLIGAVVVAVSSNGGDIGLPATPTIAVPRPTTTTAPPPPPTTAPTSPSSLPAGFVALPVSPNDEKAYAYGILASNRLPILVISDPSTLLAAAAVNVNAGSIDNPHDIQGLAHFLEHMLFLGTEKYPDEDAYFLFLSQHGGYANAYTATDNTNYYFQVDSKFLREPLDQLAQFFVSPLLNVSALAREANAVNNEHNKNINNDLWRMYRMTQVAANASHPYSWFFTGDLETLLPPSPTDYNARRDQILAFFQAYYAASTCQVVVYGSESLQTLIEWTTTSFSALPLVTTPTSVLLEDDPEVALAKAYGPSQVGRLVRIVPVQDIRRLTIMWPLRTFIQVYRQAPFQYLLMSLLGDESQGSIYAALNRLGWATALTSDFELLDFATLVYLTIDLTENGRANADSVVELVFAYVHLLAMQSSAAMERYFDEQQQIASLAWLFPNKADPASLVSSLSARMAHVVPQDIVWNPQRAAFTWSSVQEVLEWLGDPDMSIIFLKAADQETDQVEQFYAIHYAIEPFKATQREAWKSANASSSSGASLFFPVPNIFVVNDTTVNPINPLWATSSPTKLATETPSLSLWYQQDSVFLQSRDVLQARLIPDLDINSLLATVFVSLYVGMVADRMNELVYPAELAGYTVEIMPSSSQPATALQVRIVGWSQKFAEVIQLVVDQLQDTAFNESRFDLVKQLQAEDVANLEYLDAYRQALYWERLLLIEERWAREDTLQVIQQFNFSTFQQFVPCMFARFKVEALWIGNSKPGDAEASLQPLVAALSTVDCPAPDPQFPFAPPQDLAPPLLSIGTLPPGSNFVLNVTYPLSINTALVSYWQFGPASVGEQALLRVLGNLLYEHAFNRLRTNEQLGYIVSMRTDILSTVYGLMLIIQSTFAPAYLSERARVFWNSVQDILNAYSDDDLRTIQDVAGSILAPPPQSLLQLSDTYFSEILAQTFVFDRAQRQTQYIQSLSSADLKRQMIGIVETLGQRCFEVQVFTATSPPLSLSPNQTLIADWAAFKTGIVQ